ncbi:cytochrome c oxidase assembly protein [Naasia lichenicola]|uniref:Copper transporter n=1 Tax=Naasia lichenicola TaxID=2565933 RepID=A0A4S4FIN9_9MICO|nr:copper transporter [Naasia lichenicola]
MRVLGPAIVLASALVAVLVGLAIGGGAAPTLIDDPGSLVRYGLPLTKLLVDLSAAVTIGALALVAFALPLQHPASSRVLDVAAGAAGVWTVVSAASALFSFLTVTGVPLAFDERFGAQLGYYLTDIDAGIAWLQVTLIAAAVTVLAFAVRNQTALALVFVLSCVAVLPLASQGHAATASDHDQAVTALALHLVFASIWLGGLVVLIMIRRSFTEGLEQDAVKRYSSLALICFLVVAVSGYVSAELRIGSLERLASPYGLLVLVKVGALLVLGGFGVVHRRYAIARLAGAAKGAARRWFWQLVAVELVFMGIASGAAAALARTASPVLDTELPPADTPAEILTGQPLPPPFDFSQIFLQWRVDLIWLLFCGFAITFYLAGVLRLHRRGDSWPIHRTILWIAGMLLLAWLTNGSLNVYERYLFSAHMLHHMLLAMMVPVLLVPGAPVTLAARAIRKRTDGSRGGREWILLAVHSRFGQFVSHPIVAALLFAMSLLIFYYSPLFRWSTVDHIGHEWMVAHFLLTGYLFVQALVGVDPVPVRLPYPLRLLLLLGTMAFHAFFGLALLSGSALLLADWYGAMGWGTSALADQQAGGGIAWGIGEFPTVVLAIVVAIQWSRSDVREAARKDRSEQRTGDSDLTEYNAMLARLAGRQPR